VSHENEKFPDQEPGRTEKTMASLSEGKRKKKKRGESLVCPSSGRRGKGNQDSEGGYKLSPVLLEGKEKNIVMRVSPRGRKKKKRKEAKVRDANEKQKPENYFLLLKIPIVGSLEERGGKGERRRHSKRTPARGAHLFGRRRFLEEEGRPPGWTKNLNCMKMCPLFSKKEKRVL